MSTNEVIKWKKLTSMVSVRLKNLNITLSNFEAEIIILQLATEAEMKNWVSYKNNLENN